jgi:dTDP-4-dehydrorhamnose 3,5-epimerase
MIKPTAIDGLLVIERSTRSDERGFFREPFRLDELEAAVGEPVRFVQQNHARSRRGVLRGLHAENWEKLVYVPQGRVFVAVADVRPESPTFGKVATFELGDGEDAAGADGAASAASADGAAGGGRRLSLFLPRRVGHGYCVLSDTADYVYLVTEYYDGSDTHAVRWDDPDLAVPWPAIDPILSERDKRNPSLRDVVPGAFATGDARP